MPFTNTAKHCRTLLRIKDTDNQTLYFRYYDPIGLQQFFAYASPEQARRLFGPIQFFLLESTSETEQNSGILRYWETDTGVTHAPITIEPEPESDWPFAQAINTLEPQELEWRAQHAQTHQIRMEHAQASRSGLGMLVIDIPKMQQQRLKNETDFIQWYVDDYMPEHLPDIAQAFSEEERKKMVKKARHTALQQGFKHPENQAVFVTLMWEVGPDFYKFPSFQTILNNSNLSEEERTDQLYDVTEADKKAAFNKADHRIWFQEDIQ